MKHLLFSLFFFWNLTIYCQTEESTYIDEVPFEAVESVPLYQGCHESMTNDEKRQCMRIKLFEFVNENLDINFASKNNISEANIRINVLFKIDTEGNIIDVEARGKYPKLVEEAKRIVKAIPGIQKPGVHHEKPVIVQYTLPITFNEKMDNESNKNRTFPVYRSCNKNSKYEVMEKCTSDRIRDFIIVNTNLDEAEKLFPTERSTQIQVAFVIDKKGSIKDIEVKAHKREMAVLAIRTLKQLPKMKAPGTINGKSVDVPFQFFMTFYFD
ncbi:MAG: hypothetical protein ACSHXF_05235 [Aquaticitalea sp.]